VYRVYLTSIEFSFDTLSLKFPRSINIALDTDIDFLVKRYTTRKSNLKYIIIKKIFRVIIRVFASFHSRELWVVSDIHFLN
jgi:hypothetical protein